MRIIIRTDSSEEIGSGHLMRCLTLAASSRAGGAEVSFVSRNLKGNNNRLIRENDFPLHTLPSLSDTEFDTDGGQYEQYDSEQCQQLLNANDPAEWIIVDHYRLAQSWEKAMRGYADKVMVIDDLANRPHDCDLLLDQNLFEKLDSRYDGLVTTDCLKLLGPSYAMLRDQFLQKRETLRRRTGRIERLLVFLGAADSNAVTEKTLDGLELLKQPGLAIDLVIGVCNHNSARIQKRCDAIPNCDFHQQVDNMAEMMAAADLAVGAGGSTTWERCCLGLPTLFVATSDNEIELALTCGKIEIGKYLGTYREIDGQTIKEELVRLLKQPDLLLQWGANAARLVDGGGVGRVFRKMLSLTKAGVA